MNEISILQGMIYFTGRFLIKKMFWRWFVNTAETNDLENVYTYALRKTVIFNISSEIIFVYIPHKNSLPTSQRTQFVSIIKTDLLMLWREMIRCESLLSERGVVENSCFLGRDSVSLGV